MASRKQKQEVAELERLRAAGEQPESEDSRRVLSEALRGSSWLAASEAAVIVGRHSLHALAPELLGVWARLSEDGAKRDPGCRAKLAALTALDQLDHRDPDIFLSAVRYRQPEPVFGGKADSAGPVRVRALDALLRMLHSDAGCYAGELLADADAAVRAGAAHALGYYGSSATAGLLVHKLCSGDPEPSVVGEVAAALLSVALEFALGLFAAWLRHEDELRREVAALTLGSSSQGEAVALLIDWLEAGGYAPDLEVGIRALGLNRSERAREYLLTLLRDGPRSRAELALDALAAQRYDPKFVQRVLTVASERGDRDLDTRAARLFRSD